VTDNGKEFGKLFTKSLENINIGHKTVEAYRHRSMALVERKNQKIGKIIHRILMQAESAGFHSSQWTEHLSKIIDKINEKVIEISEAREEKEKQLKSKSTDESITFNPKNKINMLKEGDEVRVSLDSPIDVNGNKLHGKFRSSDIRWNPKVRIIERVLLTPGQPIMYMLDGKNGEDDIGDVAYTYNQLQKVWPQERVEAIPLIPVEEDRREVKEIIDRGVDEDNVTWYLVWWLGQTRKNATWQTKESLVEDLGLPYLNRIDKKLNK
jgi:hypothetical protein